MIIYLFKSTREVINAENILQSGGIFCRIIPVPRSISSECGMGIEISENKENSADNIFFRNHIGFKKFNNYVK
jgi:hypothetical protein